MIGSEVAVYNLALNAIGARNNVTSPDEASREAEVCRLWYPAVRDQILAAAVWPEATRFDYLGLINQQDDDVWKAGEARPGYTFSYELPTDCLRPQYLSKFDRFLITAGANNKKLLHTNVSQAILFYTFRQEVVANWSSELQMAIVYGLAANVCMPLSGKSARAESTLRKANSLVIAARESAANGSNEIFESVPDWISGRGYGVQVATQYLYPYGSLLTVAA